jgi:hypothetical protein
MDYIHFNDIVRIDYIHIDDNIRIDYNVTMLNRHRMNGFIGNFLNAGEMAEFYAPSDEDCIDNYLDIADLEDI